jgi:glycyl-tRNA synthetase beta chain
MADFLLELRCEEIPARMQAGARAELEKLFRRELDAAGVKAGELTIWSTPRRLALIARGLPLATEAVSEEAKGPPEGAPDAAIDGFCRKAGVSRDQLELRDVKGRMTYFAVIEQPGRAMADVLAAAIPAIIRDFSWPKSMRWGAASISTDSIRWVRPLSGIVALLDDAVVPCEVGGIAAGRETYGHRFHAKGPITIDGVDEYAIKLRDAFVIVGHEERQNIIRADVAKAFEDMGLEVIADEGLVIENAGLTEWPVPLVGGFDEAFLAVPPEVIQLSARLNQKYFMARTADETLAPVFACVANIAAHDGGALVVAGNEKVLAARLSDARFFWEQDQKTSLEDHAKKLARITFHEKLGTVADKVERVAKLARWLCEEGIVTDTPLPLAGGAGGGHEPAPTDIPTPNPSRRREGDLADLAEAAARLCKADLVTEMVGEFPELQGLMGGYYAAKEGLPQEVAEAIRDHYKPVGQGDDVPTASVTVAVSLADKLDTLATFFAIGELPTGSKDPFALRRAALGILALIQSNELRFPIAQTAFDATSLLLWQIADQNRAFTWDGDEQNEQLITAHPESFEVDWLNRDWYVMFGQARDPYSPVGTDDEMAFIGADGVHLWKHRDALIAEFANFFADRLKVQQREAGVRHDLIDAVFALGGEDDLVRLLARVQALQAFVTTEDGTNLLAGYKRAANILKKESFAADEGGLALSYTPEEAEKALIDALDSAAPLAEQAVAEERFADAMAALATLRASLDRFFEEVTVNDAQADKRSARLALLARFRDAVHRVADFSRIEG